MGDPPKAPIETSGTRLRRVLRFLHQWIVPLAAMIIVVHFVAALAFAGLMALGEKRAIERDRRMGLRRASEPQSSTPTPPAPPPQTARVLLPTPTEVCAARRDTSTSPWMVWGESLGASAALIALPSGELGSRLPQGYTTVPHDPIPVSPRFLIVRRAGAIATYDFALNRLRPVPVALVRNERLIASPSATDPDHFLLRISEYDPNEEEGLGWPTPRRDRAYTYNAGTGILVPMGEPVINAIVPEHGARCVTFDSKHDRLFVWLCGEGVGSALPLSTVRLRDGMVREVLSPTDLGEPEGGWAPVLESEGRFLALPVVHEPDGGGFRRIVVLDGRSSELRHETYTVADDVLPMVRGGYGGYGVAMDDAARTIVFGGADSVVLLRYDAERRIVAGEVLDEPGVYANHVRARDGVIAYHSPAAKAIRIIDLCNRSTDRFIPIVP